MPVAYGGAVRSLEEIEKILKLGIEKIGYFILMFCRIGILSAGQLRSSAVRPSLFR